MMNNNDKVNMQTNEPNMNMNMNMNINTKECADFENDILEDQSLSQEILDASVNIRRLKALHAPREDVVCAIDKLLELKLKKFTKKYGLISKDNIDHKIMNVREKILTLEGSRASLLNELIDLEHAKECVYKQNLLSS